MYFQLCSASLQRGKAAGKEGTGQMAAAGARAQSMTQGLVLHTPPRGGKTGHHVPLQQQCQSEGSIPGPRHPKPLSGSLRGIFWDAPLPWHKGIYPLVFCLCQRKSVCQGASSRHWGRACGNRDLQLS